MKEQSIDDLLWDISLLQLANENYNRFFTRKRRIVTNKAVQELAGPYGDEHNARASLYAILALWKWAHSDYRKSGEAELSDRIKNFSKGPKQAYEKRLHDVNYTFHSTNLFIDLILWNHVRVHEETKLTFAMVVPLVDFLCQFGIFDQKPLDEDDADSDVEDILDQAYHAIRQRVRRLKVKFEARPELLDRAAITLAKAVYATFR